MGHFTRRRKGSKKPSSHYNVEGARVHRGGGIRPGAAAGEIRAALEPLSSLGSTGSPVASWFYIKQLTEPQSKDGEFISTRQIQTMTKNQSYIAIDIAKESLQVQASDYACALTYDQPGLKRLRSILEKQAKGTIVVCEATGGYERTLIAFLHSNKQAVALLNPARVRAFARSQGLKAKTDPLDARMLLRYALERRPEPTPAACPYRQKLAALMDRRGHLTEMLAREKNRLQNTEKILKRSIEKMIRFIERELAALEKEIEQLVQSNQQIRDESEIMQSVVGVGAVTAWSISAYLPEISSSNRAQVAALAGLAPYNQDSGKMKGRRCIRGGRQKIRGPLYMAATAAAVHNQHIKKYVDHLQFDDGRPYKWAITAAMRKILLHLQSLLKNHEKQLV